MYNFTVVCSILSLVPKLSLRANEKSIAFQAMKIWAGPGNKAIVYLVSLI